MGFVNKVMLMGNLTRDPELRQLPSGSAVCDFTIATNRVYKTAAGEEKQETVFADCTAFGRTGEVIAEYCVQGRPLFVEGRLHYETWEDKAGSRRSKLSVIVESFQFVGSREGGESGQRTLPLKAEPKRVAEKAEAARGENRGTARRAGADRFEKGQRPAEQGRKPAKQAAAKAVETATAEDDAVEDADLPF